jgi:hypothetical protein
MKQLFKCIPVLLLLLTGISYAQEVPLGAWKDYLSYRNGITVSMGLNTQKQNVIYCVAGSGLFSYNTSDNSIEKLSKVTGLSDVSPAVARFNNYDNILFIGYTDGNMDILNNKTIINIPYLKISSVQGSKSVNCVCFSQNYAYVGCGQGILQVDLTQDVIQNTFTFGPSATALNVRGVSICNDTIFAATDKGVYFASLSDPFINNYTHWHNVPSPTVPAGIYNTVATVGDSVFVNWSNNLTNNSVGDSVFVYYKGLWNRCTFPTLKGTTIYSLESSMVKNKNYLVASTTYVFSVYDQSGNSAPVSNGAYIPPGNSNTGQVFDAMLDPNGNMWTADNLYGLVKVNLSNNSATIFTPSGPYNNQVFSLAVNDNNLWIMPGAYDATFIPRFFNYPISSLQGQTWNYINEPTNVFDFNCIAIDPWKPLHYFVGSFTSGLVEFNNNAVVNIWNSSNTNNAMQPTFNAGSTSSRIGGVAYDTIGNVWATSCLATSQYLCVEKPDLSWVGFDFSAFLGAGSIVTNVIVTQSQAKWLLFNGLGILAYQDNGTYAKPTSSNTHLITTQTGNGALPDVNVNCMAVDQNGSIWVGTDERVVVFYSPDNVFDGNHDWDAQPVYVTQNGYTQYLMQNQVTTAIAVDGGNRKWIGTQGGGVFLMSADGTQQIYNFTATNSPLLSNNIQSIAINPNNGEVFFGTDKGVVSFKSTATEGLTSFGNVYAYPDPVPHGYNGPVAIKNLVTNADVKITTINGELVYHTIALGGQAIWNGTNFEGKRVQTGVYLVFCASPDGNQTLVSKLLFIN